MKKPKTLNERWRLVRIAVEDRLGPLLYGKKYVPHKSRISLEATAKQMGWDMRQLEEKWIAPGHLKTRKHFGSKAFCTQRLWTDACISADAAGMPNMLPRGVRFE